MPHQQPSARRASWLRRVWVVSGSVGITCWYSIKVLCRAAVGRLDRSIIDAYARTWAAVLLRLVRMQLSVHGQSPAFNDGRRYLILCTHSSHYDIPTVFMAMPGSIRMLAKQELFRIPLMGRAMRVAEFPSISRQKHRQALKELAQAREMMESGIVLWAAPEGTRSTDGRLQPFKRGCFNLALDTNAVIVPVAIRGIHRVLPARTWRFNLDQPVELLIGKPIDTNAYSKERVAELMQDTRASMENLLYGTEEKQSAESTGNGEAPGKAD